MRAGPALKTKQAFWETPRNLAIIIGAVASTAGVLGFKIGQMEPVQQPTQIIFQPGSIVAPPSNSHP